MDMQRQKNALYITAFIVALLAFTGFPYVVEQVLLVLAALFVAYTAFRLNGKEVGMKQDMPFVENKPQDGYDDYVQE